jgi:hypothetical protein
VTGHDLASIYGFSYFAIHCNLKGLTNDDSVFIPKPSGNCINWVLGHVISARGIMLLLTGGGTRLFTAEEAATFQRGPAAIKSGKRAMDLERLKTTFEESRLPQRADRDFAQVGRQRGGRSSNDCATGPLMISQYQCLTGRQRRGSN